MTFARDSFFKFYIHATNIHQGGGKTLLTAIIEALPSSGYIVLLLDSRMSISTPIPDNVDIKKITPSIAGRIKADRWLSKDVQTQDIVLCFGNLPPLFKLNGKTFLYLQNRYLIEEISLNRFPFKVRIRVALERFWIKNKLSNVTELIVQTPTMKRLVEKKWGNRVLVNIIPFTANSTGYTRRLVRTTTSEMWDFDFIYIASGEPHKNHKRLLEAWCLLAKEGIFPSLHLTLNNAIYNKLCIDINKKLEGRKLNITNESDLSHQNILSLYRKSKAIIFPSTFESFGLPLIEARQANIPILASELDFVRDVLDPEETFDPNSSISIARAVKRFMSINEDHLPLLDGKSFIEKILNLKR